MCWFFLGPKVKANGKMPAVHPGKPSRNPCRCWRWVGWQRLLHRPCLQHQTHKLSWVEHHGWYKIIYQNHIKIISLTTLHHFTSISRPILSPLISLNASALCQHGWSAFGRPTSRITSPPTFIAFKTSSKMLPTRAYWTCPSLAKTRTCWSKLLGSHFECEVVAKIPCQNAGCLWLLTLGHSCNTQRLIVVMMHHATSDWQSWRKIWHETYKM